LWVLPKASVMKRGGGEGDVAPQLRIGTPCTLPLMPTLGKVLGGVVWERAKISLSSKNPGGRSGGAGWQTERSTQKKKLEWKVEQKSATSLTGGKGGKVTKKKPYFVWGL